MAPLTQRTDAMTRTGLCTHSTDSSYDDRSPKVDHLNGH